MIAWTVASILCLTQQRTFCSAQANSGSTPQQLRCTMRWTRAENTSPSRTTAMSPCGYWQRHSDRKSQYQRSYTGRKQQPTKHRLYFPSITNAQSLHRACLLSRSCRFCSWSVKQRVGWAPNTGVPPMPGARCENIKGGVLGPSSCWEGKCARDWYAPPEYSM